MALDLDGSLLTSRGELSARVREAVQATLRRGVVVTLATGRRLATTQSFARDLGITAPLIVHNGAVVAEPGSGRPLHQLTMCRDTAGRALEELRAAGLGVFLYQAVFPDETIYYDAPRTLESMKRFYFEVDDHLRYAPDLASCCSEGALRLIAVGSREATSRALGRLHQSAWGGRVLAWPEVLAGEVVTEFQHRDTSKAAGLRALAGALGIPRERVLAIGDHVNDLEMIRDAGLGVAMGNAPPQVKEAAGWITRDCDHDGVAWALEVLVLNKG
ncbi:MAG: HAD hydrolase family protein [Acetobacteraceae bacterium]|nr:HAD hydrolase family protein [Acetobacteraceae bacterium]